MLTETDLAILRAAQTETFDRTCDVRRPEWEDDGYGGQKLKTDPPTAKHTNVACRRSARGLPDEYIAAARLAGRTPWMVTMAWDADVQVGDILEMDDGSMLTVVGTLAGESYQTALRVVCEEAR